MAPRLEGRLADPDRRSPGEHCPIDRALSVVGTRSALLLMREASYGTTRFDDLAARAGLSDAVAAARLRDLREAGLLERRPYREEGQRTRQEYVLTESGEDLLPVLLALAAWGRKHTDHAYSPRFTHAGCGAQVEPEVRCAEGHVVAGDALVISG
jgi:DNA-binding HxlR family transcriptional regulator